MLILLPICTADKMLSTYGKYFEKGTSTLVSSFTVAFSVQLQVQPSGQIITPSR